MAALVLSVVSFFVPKRWVQVRRRRNGKRGGAETELAAGATTPAGGRQRTASNALSRTPTFVCECPLESGGEIVRRRRGHAWDHARSSSRASSAAAEPTPTPLDAALSPRSDVSRREVPTTAQEAEHRRRSRCLLPHCPMSSGLTTTYLSAAASC
ncbi:hypothetical protein OsJ_20963 [Oryza sativa Japonica Group]|uniref:Uncharacterized protein n=1 Tax=Oryza sativa subsp. japonica TaxID=39947 RepID=A3BAM8_ORYSJ|nr:hypothetical protein OsJ_20963 [Oryza sativa Japonica Group]